MTLHNDDEDDVVAEPELPPAGMNGPGWLKVLALLGAGVGFWLVVALRHH